MHGRVVLCLSGLIYIMNVLLRKYFSDWDRIGNDAVVHVDDLIVFAES